MDSEQPQNEETPGGVASMGPSVRLHFHLGQADVSGDELQQLAPGKLYPLDTQCLQSVQVVSGRSVLAQGRVVQLDNQVAIQITNLHS